LRTIPRVSWLDNERLGVPLKLTAIAIVLALVVGLPLGWIVAMMLTPLLWDLEPVFHMELAGHSGPSDSIFYLVWAIVIPSLFLLFCWIGDRARAAE
jgi:ABC-type antimicrobial peptide transport system permease subunit